MKYDSSRRTFLKMGAALMGLPLAGSDVAAGTFPGIAASGTKKLPPLSFSTLGCPDWTFPAIMDFAQKNNYQGLEIRGILRQMDLPKCPEFSGENIAATLRQMGDHGLKFVDLGSSTELHHADAATRQRQLDDGRRFIDLAHQLNCPYIRVFPNNLPKDQDRNATIDLIIKGLIELGEHARNSGVTVLMESHGEIVESTLLEQIMKQSQNLFHR